MIAHLLPFNASCHCCGNELVPTISNFGSMFFLGTMLGGMSTDTVVGDNARFDMLASLYFCCRILFLVAVMFYDINQTPLCWGELIRPSSC